MERVGAKAGRNGSSGAGSVKRKDLGLEIGIWICHGPWTNPANPTKHTFAKERSSYKLQGIYFLYPALSNPYFLGGLKWTVAYFHGKALWIY